MALVGALRTTLLADIVFVSLAELLSAASLPSEHAWARHAASVGRQTPMGPSSPHGGQLMSPARSFLPSSQRIGRVCWGFRIGASSVAANSPFAATPLVAVLPGCRRRRGSTALDMATPLELEVDLGGHGRCGRQGAQGPVAVGLELGQLAVDVD